MDNNGLEFNFGFLFIFYPNLDFIWLVRWNFDIEKGNFMIMIQVIRLKYKFSKVLSNKFEYNQLKNNDLNMDKPNLNVMIFDDD